MSDDENWNKNEYYAKGDDSDYVEEEKEAVRVQNLRLKRLIDQNLIPTIEIEKNNDTNIFEGKSKNDILNDLLGDDYVLPKIKKEKELIVKSLKKEKKTINKKIENKLEDKKLKGIKIMIDKNRQMIEKANRDLARGRGMFRKRKAKQGNSKLMNKLKFQKKEKIRKNYVKEYTEKPLVYTGEATGIRRDLNRSTKIN